MAKTKTKPGPKPRYGDRENIHIEMPVTIMAYIRSVSDNVTKWMIEAAQQRMERDTETPQG